MSYSVMWIYVDSEYPLEHDRLDLPESKSSKLGCSAYLYSLNLSDWFADSAEWKYDAPHWLARSWKDTTDDQFSSKVSK